MKKGFDSESRISVIKRILRICIIKGNVMVGKEKKILREMFFKKREMIEIEDILDLKESVIRRIIKENNWYVARDRYLKFLCYISHRSGESLFSLSNRLSIKYYSLCRIRKKYNITKAPKKAWNDRRSDDIERKVVGLYGDGWSGDKIAKRLGYKRRETIYQILQKNGIERKPSRRYTYYNESFFEFIDSYEKAYILGLIMTDGNIIKNYNGFEIQLTKEDGYILEKISDLIGAAKSHAIQNVSCDHKRLQKGFENSKDMVRLTVHNSKIADDLRELGVLKKKTKILRYNGVVSQEFLGSFFRGVMDGDGTVGVQSDNGRTWLSFASASERFVDDLLEVLPFQFTKYKRKTTHSPIYIGEASGGEKNTIAILKWMYKNKSDFYLRRKYEKVQNKIH